jgi:hypothetical protein
MADSVSGDTLAFRKLLERGDHSQPVAPRPEAHAWLRRERLYPTGVV